MAVPDYYLTHPALTYVAEPSDYWDIFWKDDTHAILRNSSGAEVWTEYLLPDDGSGIVILGPTTLDDQQNSCTWPVPLDERPSYYNIPITDPAWNWSDSPDCTKAVVITRTLQPIATVKFGIRNIAPLEGLYYEIWLVEKATASAQAVFYTAEDFNYDWTRNDRFIFVHSVCYGGNENAGNGSFAIDAQKPMIYRLGDYGGPCEGGVGASIAPGGAYIVFQNDGGTLETIQGTGRRRLCPPSDFARSYTWSADGKYVYVACGRNEQSDVLYRYDTQTSTITMLTDPNVLRFKAMRFIVSPNQNRLLFTWGTSDFANLEPYGVWLLDLTKLRH